METLRPQSREEQGAFDADHASIVNFQPEARTYVTDPPIIIGERAVFLNDLSPEHRQLFEDFIPIPLEEYSDVETFIADERPEGDRVGTLNFMGYFQPSETVAGFSHKSRNVFKRLQVLAPELVIDLEERLADAHSIAELTYETQERLLYAYNLMTHLVDARDHLQQNWDMLRSAEEPMAHASYYYDYDYLKH